MRSTGAQRIPHQKEYQWVKPLTAFIPIDSIQSPLCAVADPASIYPHTYLFVKGKAAWAKIFQAYCADYINNVGNEQEEADDTNKDDSE